MLKVNLKYIFLALVCFSILFYQTSYAQSAQSDTIVPNNGIFVDKPKVYDDSSLQLLLSNLKNRLGQLSGLEQSSLINKIGGMQGASATQSGFSMQVNGMPLPGVTATSNQANPTTQTINYPNNPSNNQTTTSSPGSTYQTIVTTPPVTPFSPAQPNSPSYNMPSSFSTSSLDTLGEQMQLNYEMINLQMLLEGSLSDRYRKHVTIGFPISITVPNKDYRHAVAEVEITICNPPIVDNPKEAPSIMAVLPREKTYNVASLVNKSLSLGVGAVISGIINVGGNFLSGHETYYVVRDQDTVVIQRPARSDVCASYISYKSTGDKVPSKALTFAWQFRPVLGQKVVQDGLRQTFAQISFPSSYSYKHATVIVRTKWRKYDSNHIVGADLSEPLNNVPDNYYTLDGFSSEIWGVKTVDNYDGSMTVRVDGKTQLGDNVRIGSVFLNGATLGFPDHISFTASNQALALNGASIVSRDGEEMEIDVSNPGKPEIELMLSPPIHVTPEPVPTTPPTPTHDTQETVNESPPAVILTPFSNTLVRVDVRLRKTKEDKEPPKGGGPYPLVVIIGGKAFGLSDAPFKIETDAKVVFLAPKDLLRNQRTLIVKRLFLGKNFKYPVNLPPQNDFTLTGLTVLSENPKYTNFAIMGTSLKDTEIMNHAIKHITIHVQDDETMGFFKLTKGELAGLKQLVFKNGNEPPVLVAVPGNKPLLKPQEQAISQGTGVKYTINGSMLESVTAIKNMDNKTIPFLLSPDKNSLILALSDEMTATPGIRSIFVNYSDGSIDRYTVTVTAK